MRGEAVLVFDNATDPDEVNMYIPASGVWVIITSTCLSFAELGTLIGISAHNQVGIHRISCRAHPTR